MKDLKEIYQLFPLSSFEKLKERSLETNVARILFDTNRKKPGKLFLMDASDDGIRNFVWYTCEVYGKADNQNAITHNNPSRDPLKPYGDTPTGLWKVTAFVDYHDSDPEKLTSFERSYGTEGFFRLEPLEGDCLRAYEEFKRNGILLHGGETTDDGMLRAAFGCIRTRNIYIRVLQAFRTGNEKLHRDPIPFNAIEVQEYPGGFSAWKKS